MSKNPDGFFFSSPNLTSLDWSILKNSDEFFSSSRFSGTTRILPENAPDDLSFLSIQREW